MSKLERYRNTVPDSDVPGVAVRAIPSRRAKGRFCSGPRESDRPQVSLIAIEAADHAILNKVLFGGVSPAHLQKRGFPMKLTSLWSEDILKGKLPNNYPSVQALSDACQRVYDNNNLRFDDQGNIVSVKN